MIEILPFRFRDCFQLSVSTVQRLSDNGLSIPSLHKITGYVLPSMCIPSCRDGLLNLWGIRSVPPTYCPALFICSSRNFDRYILLKLVITFPV